MPSKSPPGSRSGLDLPKLWFKEMMAQDRLADDPIVEALFELQFETQELIEVVVGRLSDLPLWKASPKVRLPNADIPAPLREANGALKYGPTLEVIAPFGKVRIGGNVLSLHFFRPYPGWELVFPTLSGAIRGLFDVLPAVNVTRLGLRYVNVFTSDRHFVTSLQDLFLTVVIGKDPAPSHLTLAQLKEVANSHTILTKIASLQFLVGDLPLNATVALDIDVVTPTGFAVGSAEEVESWVGDAHAHEKAEFTSLLPPELHEKLRSK